MKNWKDLFSRQILMFKQTLFNSPIKIYWTWFVWSNFAYTLSKTGFKYFFLTDPDIVKEHNLLNQCFWNYKDLNKVEALKNYLSDNASYDLNIFTFPTWLEEQLLQIPLEENDIVLIATDNIESRINFINYVIENWDNKNLRKTTFLFVNTNNEVIYMAITKNNKDFFIKMKKNLLELNSNNSTDWLCWEKSSFYLWNLISGYLISEIRKIDNQSFEDYTSEILFEIKNNKFNYEFKWNS